jgi:hypothetical protein
VAKVHPSAAAASELADARAGQRGNMQSHSHGRDCTRTQEGDDERFDGRRLVACPAHCPTSPGFDLEALRSERDARDTQIKEGAAAATAAAAVALAAAVPGAAATALGAAAAAGGRMADDEMEAAELLTGIKCGGPHSQDASPVARARRAAHAASTAAAPAAAGGKRRRSLSGEGSAVAASAAASEEEDADEGGLAHQHHGMGAAAKRRATHSAPAPLLAPASSLASGQVLEAAGDACLLAGGAVGGVPADLLQRLQQLAAAGDTATAAAAGAGGGSGAGLLHTLQPALLGPGGGAAAFGALLGGGSGGLPDACALGEAFGAAGAVLGGTTGQQGRPGRCAVCVVQRKGKCGTDSAPKKCMRRQQALLDAAALEQKLRQQLAAQQDQALLEQLQLVARQEHAAHMRQHQEPQTT